jgi:hypothetical protein
MYLEVTMIEIREVLRLRGEGLPKKRIAAQLLKTLKHARLDNSSEAELRKLVAVDLLILDDFASTSSTQSRAATSTTCSSSGIARALLTTNEERRTKNEARSTKHEELRTCRNRADSSVLRSWFLVLSS